MHKGLSDLSFFTTSMDGVERLLLSLNFLRSCGFDGKYIIVDASQHSQSEHFAAFNFVEYFHDPFCSPAEGAARAAQHVQTAYAAFIGDDDLPILSGVRKLVSFLEANPNFQAAHGYAGFIPFTDLSHYEDFGFTQRIKFAAKVLSSARYDKSTRLNSDDPKDRLQRIVNQYIVTQFFVTRSEITKKIYNQKFEEMKDVHASEYAYCLSHALLCKSKFIPHTYLLRGIGEHRPNADQHAKRHVLATDGSVEKTVEDFVDTLGLSAQGCSELAQEIIRIRQKSEARRLSSHQPKRMSMFYFVHQLRRLIWVIFGHTNETVTLALFGNSRFEKLRR